MGTEHYDYDLFVIGAGSGGVRASRIAAETQEKVAISECRHLGGTCVNIGCVPKKLFVYASQYNESFQSAIGYGWDHQKIIFNWSRLINNKNKEIIRLNNVYRNLLVKSGVDLIEGKSKLIDAHTIDVNGTEYSAKRILIATGSKPFIPNVEGIEHAIISDDTFYLDDLPKKIIIIGGGYIAVEFASIFSGLGVETTLAYRGDLFLRGFDNDIRQMLSQEMQKKSVTLKFNINVERIEKLKNNERVVYWSNETTDKADHVLYATGRISNTDGLNLAEIGIKTTRDKSGSIIVNENFQSSIPSIYAIGDVINRLQLTPVAIKEAMALTNYWYHNIKPDIDYGLAPTAVFCHPSIGTVGLTEQTAKKKYNKVVIYKSEFRSMRHTLGGSNERSLVKLVVDGDTDQVLGCHMLGDHAGEIIQGIGVAIQAGVTKATFDKTIAVHPTLAEEFVTMRESE